MKIIVNALEAAVFVLAPKSGFGLHDSVCQGLTKIINLFGIVPNEL